MDTKSTVVAVIAIVAMFLALRYFRGMENQEDLILIAEDKARIWQEDGKGKLQFPEVHVAVLNPPYEGAVLQLTGNVFEDSDLKIITKWLEQEDPRLLPEEYVFDVKVSAWDGVPAANVWDGKGPGDPGYIGLPSGFQKTPKKEDAPINPFEGLSGQSNGGSNRLGIATMEDLEREAQTFREDTRRYLNPGAVQPPPSERRPVPQVRR